MALNDLMSESAYLNITWERKYYNLDHLGPIEKATTGQSVDASLFIEQQLDAGESGLSR